VLSHDIAQPYWLLAVMAVGVVLLMAFWRTEGAIERRGGLPLVPLALLANTALSLGLAAVLFFAFANIAFYLALTIYMQMGLHFSALESGAVVLPMALAFAVASRFATRRVLRRGVPALIEGCTVQIAGLVLIGGAVATATLDPWLLAGLLLVFGIGQGMVMAPLYSLVLSKIPASHAGSGAGILSMVQQIGNGTGVAAIGAIYFALQSRASDSVAFLVAMAVLAVALAITGGLLGVLGRVSCSRRAVG
jgi:predicted MFS family arabinose efflux permease